MTFIKKFAVGLCASALLVGLSAAVVSPMYAIAYYAATHGYGPFAFMLMLGGYAILVLGAAFTALGEG